MFNGALRDKSTKLGYLVPLCGDKCHRLGKKAVHQCRETSDGLKEFFQVMYMIENMATIRECRTVFYKNYLSEKYYDDERIFDMNPNLCMLGGRLTNDPNVLTTKTGKTVAHFRIAVQTGKEETSFFNCDAWGKTAEFIQKNFSKGRFIIVSGQLKQDDYKHDETTKNNYLIVANQVYFGDGSGRKYSEGEDGNQEQDSADQNNGYAQFQETDDGEMPF